MVFNYLYKVVRSFHGTTRICTTKWYAYCTYHCIGLTVLLHYVACVITSDE